MVLVYNCNDDVATAMFINGLQISHSFYKHFVHEVIKVRDILSRAQTYIQIEDANRDETNHSPNEGMKGRNGNQSLFTRRRIKIETSEQ